LSYLSGKFQQVGYPKETPTGCDDHKRIRRPEIGPTQRHSTLAAFMIVKEHALFTVGLTLPPQLELLSVERVVRMRDQDSFRSAVCTACTW
jgi:hypothetical protein